MEQGIVFGAIALVLGGAIWLAFFVVRRLQKAGLPKALRIVAGTLVPISLIVLALYVWHAFSLASYEASGSEEGFMSPLAILIYGFPFVILIVIASFVASLRADTHK